MYVRTAAERNNENFRLCSFPLNFEHIFAVHSMLWEIGKLLNFQDIWCFWIEWYVKWSIEFDLEFSVRRTEIDIKISAEYFPQFSIYISNSLEQVSILAAGTFNFLRNSQSLTIHHSHLSPESSISKILQLNSNIFSFVWHFAFTVQSNLNQPSIYRIVGLEVARKKLRTTRKSRKRIWNAPANFVTIMLNKKFPEHRSIS